MAVAFAVGGQQYQFGAVIVERCACGGNLKFVAVIEAQEVIEKILTHLGLSPQPPPIAPAGLAI